MKLTVGVVSYIEALDPTAAYLSVRHTKLNEDSMKDIIAKVMFAQVASVAIIGLIWFMLANPLNLNDCSEKTMALPSRFSCHSNGEDSFTCTIPNPLPNNR